MNVAASAIGNVIVRTVDGRGFTPEELADNALDKIIHIADTAPPEVAVQARAFRGALHTVLVHYLREAARARDVELAAKLAQLGHPELAKLLSG